MDKRRYDMRTFIIQKGNWNHENWGGLLPDKSWIDKVTPEHPVWIRFIFFTNIMNSSSRLDGHMALANSLAIKLAGVTKETPEKDGGTIVRDSQGNPTGIFKDNAMELIQVCFSQRIISQKVIPAPSVQEEDKALEVGLFSL